MKKLEMKKQLSILVLCVFFLSGCWATVATVASNPVFQTTVQYGVIKYLGKNQEKISQAERIVDSLIEYSTKETNVTIQELENLVIDAIPWDKLDNADKLVLTNLLIMIREQVRERVGDGVIAQDEKIQILTFLHWIKQAIYFAQK